MYIMDPIISGLEKIMFCNSTPWQIQINSAYFIEFQNSLNEYIDSYKTEFKKLRTLIGVH